jgi:hypothetical protein
MYELAMQAETQVVSRVQDMRWPLGLCPGVGRRLRGVLLLTSLPSFGKDLRKQKIRRRHMLVSHVFDIACAMGEGVKENFQDFALV